MLCLICGLALFIWGWRTTTKEGRKAFERTNAYGVQQFRSYEEACRSQLLIRVAPLACFGALFFIPGTIVELREEFGDAKSMVTAVSRWDPGSHPIVTDDWDTLTGRNAAALALQTPHCLQVLQTSCLSKPPERFKPTPIRVLCKVDNPPAGARPYSYYYYSREQINQGVVAPGAIVAVPDDVDIHRNQNYRGQRGPNKRPPS